jgi:hypothetical protein
VGSDFDCFGLSFIFCYAFIIDLLDGVADSAEL